MKKLTRIALAVIPLTLFIAIISCSKASDQAQSSSVPDSLVGSWTSNDGEETIEFSSDGKFRGRLKYGMAQRLKDLSGTYFTDGPKVAFTIDDDPPMTWEYKVSGSDVIFTYVQGGMVKIDGSMSKFSRRR